MHLFSNTTFARPVFRCLANIRGEPGFLPVEVVRHQAGSHPLPSVLSSLSVGRIMQRGHLETALTGRIGSVPSIWLLLGRAPWLITRRCELPLAHWWRRGEMYIGRLGETSALHLPLSCLLIIIYSQSSVLTKQLFRGRRRVSETMIVFSTVNDPTR